MSIREILAGGGGVKSIQTGYVDVTPTSGTDEDARFTNVTISAVNVVKAVVLPFTGGIAEAATAYAPRSKSGSIAAFDMDARLTSATNVRISTLASPTGTTKIQGRWTVVEYK